MIEVFIRPETEFVERPVTFEWRGVDQIGDQAPTEFVIAQFSGHPCNERSLIVTPRPIVCGLEIQLDAHTLTAALIAFGVGSQMVGPMYAANYAAHQRMEGVRL